MKGTERLLELQALDLAIDRLRARRAVLESGEEVRAAREKADALEDEIGEIRMALDGVRREQERHESEVRSFEAKIAAEEKRLYDGSVANPKELGSIQHEVANLRQRTARVEDEVIVQMERREELEERLPSLEADLASARRGQEELEASSATELEQVTEDLARREEERSALTPVFDEELLELYEDLRAQKRGVGAAALRDGVCGGCHQKLSPLELEKVRKAEGVRRCDYCRRILVLD